MARRSWTVKSAGGADKHMVECFLCTEAFEFGPLRYDGHHICTWGVVFCHKCYQKNRDDIVIDGYPKLVEHLDARGVTVRRNERGELVVPQ